MSEKPEPRELTLKELVFQALNNAFEGGYPETAKEDPGDVAINLMDYDADIWEWLGERSNMGENLGVPTLIPIIEEWQKGKASA